MTDAPLVGDVLLAQLKIIRERRGGASTGGDSDNLHDLRVALRRTRAMIRALQGSMRDLLPGEALTHFSERFRTLQRATSAVRDLDVLLARVDDMAERRDDLAPGIKPVRTILRRRQVAERRKLRKALSGDSLTQLLDGWEGLIARIGANERFTATAAGHPTIRELTNQEIATRYAKLVMRGHALSAALPAEETHTFRKRAKDLRYLVEFFGELSSRRQARWLQRKLQRVQDVLGEYQDNVVFRERLRDVAKQLAGGEAAPLMAIGALVERSMQGTDATVDAFGEVFRQLAKKRRQREIAAAFGGPG